ncbi:hypothetical protein IWQ60_003011 [Tieghemiomyces parasiticus]|uniref:SCP domain-containing protein n=1 Tax=Tieghemiomyces parasiticus TaxID=78921 RepID=A0A9W8AAC5_9FUNG|nr:hypothetical protein IWQ60_003011 [Tieghemiomyces parasiticus]
MRVSNTLLCLVTMPCLVLYLRALAAGVQALDSPYDTWYPPPLLSTSCQPESSVQATQTRSAAGLKCTERPSHVYHGLSTTLSDQEGISRNSMPTPPLSSDPNVSEHPGDLSTPFSHITSSSESVPVPKLALVESARRPFLDHLLEFNHRPQHRPNGKPDNAPSGHGDQVDTAIVLDLVNQQRSSVGAAPLVYDSTLEQLALKHCQYMREAQIMTHDDPQGSLGDRLSGIGVNWSSYGENVADGYPDEETVMQAWIESPGHYENIVNRRVDRMGVARVGEYWTQEFAAMDVDDDQW